MSLENVKLFYARLAIDEAFRTEVQSSKTKEECSQTVKDAGYDFTSKELEDYTAQLLDPSDDLSELDKAELESVMGGFRSLIEKFPGGSPPQQMYGVVWPPEEWLQY
jgi:predicted ribosomally synthesized peptide with nif11-like leader